MGEDRAHLPTNQPGPERKDDRLILSGIMHVLKVGCRWVDCPKAYGPPRRSTIALPAGVSEASGRKIFEAVAAPSEPPKQAGLDSRHVKVHRCASGVKGGQISGDRVHERRPQQQNPRDRRCGSKPVGVDLDAGQPRRLRHGARMIPGIKELSKTKKSSRSSRVNPTARSASGTTRAPTRTATSSSAASEGSTTSAATRYDKLAGNFFSALCLVAIIAYWL